MRAPSGTVESLPEIATQVTLLVYESEMESRTTKERLRGNLKREYHIGRMLASKGQAPSGISGASVPTTSGRSSPY